jgi:hypothetical protein
VERGEAETWAERLTKVDGYEVTVVPHPWLDRAVPAAYTVRVVKGSIPPDKLRAFLDDARRMNLKWKRNTRDGVEVLELT